MALTAAELEKKYNAMCLTPKKKQEAEISQVIQDKNSFQVKLDVELYQADELKVTLVGNHLLVEGKHDDKESELGFITRQFSRKYLLPDGVEKDKISCKLKITGTDKSLLIFAPVLNAKEPEPILIPIEVEK